MNKHDKTEPQHKKERSVEQLEIELAQKEKLVQDYENHLKRLQADFENFQKRVEVERSQLGNFVKEGLILKLLNMRDNFERALPLLQKPEHKEILKGIEMIYNELLKILKEEHVTPIEAKGKKFDPYTHEVLLFEHTNDVPEDTILEELQKGYRLFDKIIRHTKVKIAKSKESDHKESDHLTEVKENE